MSDNSQDQMHVRRVLIKLSGEMLGGDDGVGVDPKMLAKVANQLHEVHEKGVQTVLIIGGGNLFRGAAWQNAGMDRVTGDQMGMLATVMNGLAMRDELIRAGSACVLMSPHLFPSVTMQYSANLARDFLAAGSCVIVAGGTGSPFFTTDTAAVLRAIETGCDEVLKATKVEGVFSADPKVDPNAKLYKALNYKDVLAKELKVMDLTAFALASENHMPIRVFSLEKEGALVNASLGLNEGTLVGD